MCFVVEEAVHISAPFWCRFPRHFGAYFRAILVQISAPFWCRFPRHFGADFRAILVQISAPFWLIFLNPHQRFFSTKHHPKKIPAATCFVFTDSHISTLFVLHFTPNTNFSLNLIQYFILYITPYTTQSLFHKYYHSTFSFHRSTSSIFHITYHIFYVYT